jgi:hypothetical protein
MQSPASTDRESQTSDATSICFVLGLTDMSSLHAPHHPLSLVCAISILVHFPSLTIPCLDDAEQIETNIASARETFADASAGIHRKHGELKSLVDRVAKGEAPACSPVLRTAALRC